MCTGFWRCDVEVALVDDTVKSERFGEVVLYFGNRRRDLDFLYEQQLRHFVADHTLTCLHTAFSREQVRLIGLVVQ